MTTLTDNAKPPLVTLVAAVTLSVLYFVAAWYMFDTFVLKKPPDPTSYDRASALFAGIQSIGFAAVGVLLGVAVQQPRVADAKAETRRTKQAIKNVIAPSSSELGGGKNLPDWAMETLQEGL